jgi:hypothetical protein
LFGFLSVISAKHLHLELVGRRPWSYGFFTIGQGQAQICGFFFFLELGLITQGNLGTGVGPKAQHD